MKKFHETREVIDYAKKYVSGRTLDLGAGLAKYAEVIKQNASDYVTFDMVPRKNIDIVGDALNLPIEDESFETVVSTQVLEHVEKPWVAIKEIHRVLKSGGICILTAPFMEPYHPDPGDYFRYSVAGIRSLFENEGFQVIECSSYGPPALLFAKFLKFLWFSPYKKRKRGSWKMTHFMTKIGKFFDKFIKTDIIYADVYIIAKK